MEGRHYGGLPGSVRPGATHVHPSGEGRRTIAAGQRRDPRREPMRTVSAESSGTETVSSLSSWRGATRRSPSPATSVETEPEPSKSGIQTSSQKDYIVGTVWSRVTAAAEALTVSVTRAWEHAGDDEPRTPPGQDSRLTVAMKHYYLEKAHDLQDLPDWLFSERERQVPTKLSRYEPSQTEASTYDVVHSRSRYRSSSDDDQRPSRAKSKLRQMADAKRGVKNDPDRDTVPVAMPEVPRVRRAVGLPTAPRSGKKDIRIR